MKDLNKDSKDKKMIVEINMEKNIIYTNKFFRDYTGYSKEELLNNSFETTLHEDMPMCLCEKAFSTAMKGDVWDGFVKSKKKNGDFFWSQIFLQRKEDSDNNIIGFSLIKIIVSEEKTKDIIKLYKKIKDSGENSRYCGQLDE